MTQADFGFVGLGVMGHALAQNMERHGYLTAGFDLDPAKVAAFQAHNAAKNAPAFTDPQKFVAALKRPRLVMLMVPAGRPVDAAIQTFRPLLETGDLIIDGGNSHFLDTERRQKELESGQILFIGVGVSGGEQGGLWGPSLMPGGKSEAWDLIASYYKAIAAHVDGQACVTHIGPGGSGHYVKMVHNGIEYAEMQLIAEAYDLLHRGLGLSNAQLHRIFSEWNKGELESFLIEIAADIFTRMDPETGKAIVDLILDEAQQKGTGKWTSQNALDVGASIPTINTAVDARLLSALKDQRVDASHLLKGPNPKIDLDPGQFTAWLEDALYVARICAYAQGFALMQMASAEYAYNLNLSEIARIWRGGCIIRANVLGAVQQVYALTPELKNLLLASNFAAEANKRQEALRQVIMAAVKAGIPVPAFSSALAYFDAFRTARLPANLTQAQRDYFGAHTYRRLDREGIFHTDWTEGKPPTS